MLKAFEGSGFHKCWILIFTNNSRGIPTVKEPPFNCLLESTTDSEVVGWKWPFFIRLDVQLLAFRGSVGEQAQMTLTTDWTSNGSLDCKRCATSEFTEKDKILFFESSLVLARFD